MKTSELQGAALDWAVAKCEGKGALLCGKVVLIDNDTAVIAQLRYSTDWAQGGPLIEREHIEWQWLPSSSKHHRYGARKPSLGGAKRTFCMDGPTVLIAAMRCYVASKLGDEVEIPEELK